MRKLICIIAALIAVEVISSEKTNADSAELTQTVREANVSSAYVVTAGGVGLEISECLFPCEEVKTEPEWEPDPADVAYISRTIWGEVRGCTELEQREQAWCILNRVDADGFPDSVAAVVTAQNQFQGYSASNPEEPFHDLAREILILWHNGEREIPADMCFCSGNGRRQTFRNTWLITSETEFYP